MTRLKTFLTALLVLGALLILGTMQAALAADPVRREIAFPDLPGYRTLACDLHMHTVFSDGAVWPTVRVDEAWRQGLDAIAITDHVEYQPHKDDVPTQHNRPYDIAAGGARERGLLFPKGAEITRETPPGHFNAIFLSDVRPLEVPDFVEAIKRANQQGAFVFWNHHGWKGSEKGKWRDVHTTLYENKWLHGMEVANGDSYYGEAHRWCLEKNLTMLGNSDIHDPDLREESTASDHRTITLVFAKEDTLEALKEALVAGRTAVWCQDQIIGRREWLEPLLRESVKVSKPNLRTDKFALVEMSNRCATELRLQRTGNLGPAELRLPAQATVLVKIPTNSRDQPLELAYTVTNFLIAPDQGLPIVLQVPGP